MPQCTLRNSAAFRVGFMTSALNPKNALFYGSVFATALPPSPSWVHVASTVALVYFNSVVWHTGLAIAFSQKAVQRAYLRNFARLTKVSGAVVGAFGLRLIGFRDVFKSNRPPSLIQRSQTAIKKGAIHTVTGPLFRCF